MDGENFTEPLTVKMDPRVKTPIADLKRQFDLAMEVVEMMNQGHGEVGRLLSVIEEADAAPMPQVEAAVAEAKQRLSKAK